jgi:hypothetical protein
MIAVDSPQVHLPRVSTSSQEKVGALVSQAWRWTLVLPALIIADPNAKYLMDFVV